jgi:hypothetical protein
MSEKRNLRKYKPTGMCTGFSKFQGALRFVLQALPADILKALKMETITKTELQKHNK